MKKKSLILIAFSLFLVSKTWAQTELPELNKQIVQYVKSVIGKQVERGECWDLANQSLILVNADWDKQYKYGNKIDPGKDQVFPGDLIQFKNVKVQYKEANSTFTELMTHHTAIVYKVLGDGLFEIAHQNTEFSGRKVGLSKLNLNHVVKGNLYFYRPTKNRKND